MRLKNEENVREEFADALQNAKSATHQSTEPIFSQPNRLDSRLLACPI